MGFGKKTLVRAKGGGVLRRRRNGREREREEGESLFCDYAPPSRFNFCGGYFEEIALVSLFLLKFQFLGFLKYWTIHWSLSTIGYFYK